MTEIKSSASIEEVCCKIQFANSVMYIVLGEFII
jgi:hypothetical protein